MVVSPRYPNPHLNRCPFILYQRLGLVALHLFPFLMQYTRSDHEKTQVYQTILVLCLALLLAFGYWAKIALLYSAMGLLAATLLWYPLAYYLHFAWMQLAKVLGWINTRLLLGIIFFLILLPLARLRRLFQKNASMPLHPSEEESYYQERKKEPLDFTQPW